MDPIDQPPVQQVYPQQYQQTYPQQGYYQQPQQAYPQQAYSQPAQPYSQPAQPYSQPAQTYQQQAQPYQQQAQTYQQQAQPQVIQYNYSTAVNPQYDPQNIQYQTMNISSWSSIPNDRTDYSDFWSSPQSFQPETFSQNSTAKNQCQDVPCVILFWINFVLFVVLTIVLFNKPKDKIDKFLEKQKKNNTKSSKNSTKTDTTTGNSGSAYILSSNLTNQDLLINNNIVTIQNKKELHYQYYDYPKYSKVYNEKGEVSIHVDLSPDSIFHKIEFHQPKYLSSTESIKESESELLVNLKKVKFETDINKKIIGYSIGFSIAIGLVFSIIHFCFAMCAPLAYLRFGCISFIVVLFILCIIPALYGLAILMIVPIILLIVALLFLCCFWKYIPFSAALLGYSTRILYQNPSIYFLMFLDWFLEMIVCVFFAVQVFFVIICEWPFASYVYFFFAYTWITLTFSYVLYMAIAGTGATYYFLKDSVYWPKHPAMQAFKRAATTSFGSAAFAAGILAIIKTIEMIINALKNNAKDNKYIALLLCILQIILKLIESIFKFITQFALIYCATFGIPFKEGCRRFLELMAHRFINVIANRCIVSNVMSINQVTMAVLGGIAGFGVSILLIKYNLYLIILLAVLSFFLTFIIWEVIKSPLVTLTDTLLVCFFEAPENLKTTGYELYELLEKYYFEGLCETINNFLKKQSI